MSHIVTQLEREFALDHRNLTRGFAEIIAALRREDKEEAVRLALILNREGGAHIAFEESILYPKVAESRGKDYVAKLYNEHQIAIEALRDLIENSHQGPVSEAKMQELITKLQTGLEHAVSCGTLLSHLTVLDEKTQRQLLDELRRSRADGKSLLELKPYSA